MPGCDFTRRDFLRWSAVAAASPLFARRLFDNGVAAAASRKGAVSPVNLELVTLTEDRAVITWYTGYTGTDDGLGRMEPAPADGVVSWGTDPQRLNRVAGRRARDTPYHYVELNGLEPGETYYYQARSNDIPVPPTPFTLISGNAVGTSDFGLTTGGPYSFTAPEPPPGRFLFSIVLCNDLHMGETTAGLLGGSSIPGIQQAPGLPPYPEVMLRSLVEDASALGGSFLLAAGDITAEAAPVDLSKAGKLLRRFGKYRRDYFVTRGNHDRAHSGEAYAACRIGQWQGNDCFHDHFFPGDQPTYFSRELQGLRVIGIDTYDKPGRGSDAGALSTEQLAWFRAELANERDQPTIVFGHHPLIVEKSPFPVTPSNALEAGQVATILGDYAQTPGLFLQVLPASVWVEVQATAVEVDGRLEVLSVPVTAGRVADPLDFRVEAFGGRVGDAVAQVGEDVREVPLQHPRLLDHGLEPRVRRPEVPAAEERTGPHRRSGTPTGLRRPP